LRSTRHRAYRVAPPSAATQPVAAGFAAVVIVGSYPLDERLIRGGVEASVYGLTATLAARRSARRLRVISVGRVGARLAMPADALEVHFLRYPLRWQISAPLLFPAVARELGRCAGAIHHLHGTGPLAALLCGYLRLRRRPCVLTVHGVLAKELADQCARDPSAKARLQRLVYSFFERLALRWAGEIIVDTPYVERLVRPLVGRPVHVIPQGIFPRQLRVAERADRRSARDIVAVGVIERRKGHHHLIEAFARLAPRFPETRLAIIGAVTDPGYRAELAELIAAQRLGSRIRLVADADRAAILQRMAEARLFALHSEEESQGIALTEALVVGLPVVATRVGGIPDIVTHGVDGLLSDFADVARFAENLAALLDDDDRLARFSVAARRRRDEFAWETSVRRIEEVYRLSERRLGARA
jgi:glycosyltransferase involved in cell wall biosynthesis